nr:NAD(P)H-hydrate epimerase [Roseburia sp. AM51-8]
MKYILNSREMKQCDSRTIEHYGLPSMVLMERAALSVVSFLHERDLWQKKIVILCGSGNNGGDGLAIARLLYLEGGQVSVFLVGDFSKLRRKTWRSKRSVGSMAWNCLVLRIHLQTPR